MEKGNPVWKHTKTVLGGAVDGATAVAEPFSQWCEETAVPTVNHNDHEDICGTTTNYLTQPGDCTVEC